jgi:hypothetical protein
VGVCEDNNDVNVNVTLGRIMWVSVWVSVWACHVSVSVNDVFACVCVRGCGCGCKGAGDFGFRMENYNSSNANESQFIGVVSIQGDQWVLPGKER